MVSDRYRLAPLLDARARTEAVRRGDLASAIDNARVTATDRDVTRGRTAAVRTTLATAVASRDALVVRGTNLPELVRAERYITRLRRELEANIGAELRAAATYDARRDAVDIARGTLVRARAEREVIARHFASWREGRRKLAERRED